MRVRIGGHTIAVMSPMVRGLVLAALCCLALSCGSSSDSDAGCDGSCEQVGLGIADVELVIAQAVAQADALDQKVTIAVTDRVGNVLAVFRMSGAAETTLVSSQRTPPVEGGFERLRAPAELAAISKAGTAAYLSSQGNAFSTRTASQIVQEHFNPGERRRPGGPLFGVQFTQLPCGDLVTRFPDRNGPHRMPIGLSGDPGGVPLYKPSAGDGVSGRVLVGGVGVEGVLERDNGAGEDEAPETALYRLDAKISDFDDDLEEKIALAAAHGFAAPTDRRADRISVDGKFLRFTDREDVAGPAPAAFDELAGELLVVDGFSAGSISAGAVLGKAESGYLMTSFAGIPAEILVDADGVPRFPPIGAPSEGGLSESEVRSILANALAVAQRTRAQIRRPLGVAARVTIVVVDLDGTVLGIVRGRDAPVFGTDTALQKARTATFFSSAIAGGSLEAAEQPVYPGSFPLRDYVTRARVFLRDPLALTGLTAFADRSGGNLSRPFFPDGIDDNPNGPFSRPFREWSPFSTGLQLDLVFNGILRALGLLEPLDPAAAGSSTCTSIDALPNGIQIFPGSVPVYRGRTLVGGVGVSGDGVDQDDMIGFLGLHNAGVELGTVGNAPRDMRADRISVNGSHLRFVNCPVQPFVDSDEQGVCDDL